MKAAGMQARQWPEFSPQDPSKKLMEWHTSPIPALLW
ncbi:rCG42968 [Rattus norvegicus]|uniref:RCG42968 n=1 Tax=Rattus norvegicus TaxID=10116 RepID=A6IVJ7_RAT|nr:rCG42968 [Rattus norvegicus]